METLAAEIVKKAQKAYPEFEITLKGVRKTDLGEVCLDLKVEPLGEGYVCGKDLKEVERFLLNGLKTYSQPVKCPFCNGLLTVKNFREKRCSCGAVLKKPKEAESRHFLMDSILEEIDRKVNGKLKHYLEMGFTPEEVLENLGEVNYYGHFYYAVKGEVRLKGEEEIFSTDYGRVIKKLLNSGYTCVKVGDNGTLWEDENGKEVLLFPDDGEVFFVGERGEERFLETGDPYDVYLGTPVSFETFLGEEK